MNKNFNIINFIDQASKNFKILNDSLYKKAVKHFTNEDLVYILLNKTVNKNIRITLANKIDEILKYTTKEEINSIIENSLPKKKDKHDILFLDYIPRCYKYTIIRNEYEVSNTKNVDKIISIINDDKSPLKLRKLLVDFIYDELAPYNHSNLSDITSPSIKNYILTEKITNNDILIKTILAITKDDFIEEIINNGVNTTNAYKVFDAINYYEYKSNMLINIKEDTLLENLKNEEPYKLIDLLTNSKVPNSFKSKVLKTNYSKIKHYIFKKDILTNQDIFYNQKNKELTDLMYETHKLRLRIFLLLSRKLNTLEWLISSDIDETTKTLIKTKRKKTIEKQIKKISISDIQDILSYKYNTPDYNLLVNTILTARKEDIIKSISMQETSTLISNIKRIDNDIYTNLILQNYLNKDTIINFLYLLQNDILLPKTLSLINKVISTTPSIFQEILNNLKDEELFRLKLDKLDSKIRNKIVNNNKEYFKTRLSKIDKEILLEKLQSDTTLKSIKSQIIGTYGYDEVDQEVIRKLIELSNPNTILNNYPKIKSLFAKLNINVQQFINYGLGSRKYNNWLENIMYIINAKKEEELTTIKNYLFTNYYSDSDKENGVYDITNLLEILSNFKDNESLFKNIISNKKVLSTTDINNLNFYLKTKPSNPIKTYDELNNYRKNTYLEVKKSLQKEIEPKKIKEIINKLILSNIDLALEDIGGVSSLKMLEISNSDSKTIKSLTNELILYSKISTLIHKLNDDTKLIELAHEIFKTYENYTMVQDIFFNVDKKVKRLYELDSKINLTNIENIPKTKDFLDEYYMDKYGGLTYDLSDKNYCLYGHILSGNETIEDLMKGKSSPKSNFISLSPISYKGQKYYYDSDRLTLAFDKIPTGSFICSSTKNMSSNYYITKFSTEIGYLDKIQRGILETSAVTENNAEALFYREGLIPCGIILPNRKKPTKEEIEYHNKYNLPFIITQKTSTAIDNPKKVFKISDNYNIKTDSKELQKLFNIVTPLISIKKEDSIYTGREVAIITDIHALLDPTISVLEDIKRYGITEIYSLGDNIGSGPNPKEVVDLLDSYNVESILGNSEYYMTLGTKPFVYLDNDRLENEEWTKDKLGTSRIERMKIFNPSKDLVIGNKKVALCHFINDVRWDYGIGHNTYSYQDTKNSNKIPTQFEFTNSNEAKRIIEENSKNYKKKNLGYMSAKENPIFEGKRVFDYDAILQGHTHFEFKDKIKDTSIYTLEGMSIGFKDRNNNQASYYILKERKDGGFDIKKRHVEFNRDFLISNIKSSSLPHKEKILGFIR